MGEWCVHSRLVQLEGSGCGRLMASVVTLHPLLCPGALGCSPRGHCLCLQHALTMQTKGSCTEKEAGEALGRRRPMQEEPGPCFLWPILGAPGMQPWKMSPWVESRTGRPCPGESENLEQSGGALREQGLRTPLPVPAAGDDEGVRWQPPRGPWEHTTQQEAGRQMAEAEAHPPGRDAVLPGQVDPVQRCPTGLR